jgi:hypothetical protein
MAIHIPKDVQMASPASLEANFGGHMLNDDNARPDGLIPKASTKCAYSRKDRKKANWKAQNAFSAGWRRSVRVRTTT